MFVELASLFSTASFQRAFPGSRLLLSVPEVTAARGSTPPGILPFMREESDIYAFDGDRDGPEFRVVVWSDHAIVMD